MTKIELLVALAIATLLCAISFCLGMATQRRLEPQPKSIEIKWDLPRKTIKAKSEMPKKGVVEKRDGFCWKCYDKDPSKKFEYPGMAYLPCPVCGTELGKLVQIRFNESHKVPLK